MVRQFLARFMAGRYGTDQLNLTLTGVFLVVYLISLFTRSTILYSIALVLMVVCLLRSFSRRLDRRRAENVKFLQLVRPLQNYAVRLKDREHRYFKCPNCGQQMRVPRGKGRITVHCRACGTTFEENS